MCLFFQPWTSVCDPPAPIPVPSMRPWVSVGEALVTALTRASLLPGCWGHFHSCCVCCFWFVCLGLSATCMCYVSVLCFRHIACEVGFRGGMFSRRRVLNPSPCCGSHPVSGCPGRLREGRTGPVPVRWMPVPVAALSPPNLLTRPQAFILLCDLLLILSHQGPEEDTGLGLLFFVPDHVLQCKLLTFVREHVFLEETGATGQPPRDLKGKGEGPRSGDTWGGSEAGGQMGNLGVRLGGPRG